MAYMTPVEKPRCDTCGKAATQYVYNRFNARVGTLCTRHAEQYVKELNTRGV